MIPVDRYPIYFLIIFFAISCKEEKNNSVSITSFKPPVVLDTLPRTDVLKIANSINLSYPEIIAVNPFTDSCNLKNYRYSPWDTTIKKVA